MAEDLEETYPEYHVIYYEKSILPGQDLMDYMDQGVQKCDLFVLFFSAASGESKPVMDEFKMAKMQLNYSNN